MKKILLILLFIPLVSYGYDISDKNQAILKEFESRALKIYDLNPNKAYSVVKKIDDKKQIYKHKIAIYTLNYIQDFTLSYIYEYEKKLQEKQEEDIIEDREEEKSDDNTIIYGIDEEIITQGQKLKKGNTQNLKSIFSFHIEPTRDHIFLQNIYIKNTGTLNDMNVLEDIYLMTQDQKILSMGYVRGDYIYFDIPNYIIKNKNYQEFEVFASIKEPVNRDQTGELILNFTTPSDAKNGTSNGIKAISYSNGSDIEVASNNSQPVKTLITKINHFVNYDDFAPTHNRVGELTLSNNSNKKMDIESFLFEIHGSFLNSLGDGTEFILKRKDSNQVFGKATKADIRNNMLEITHTGNDYDFMSGNTTNTYALEIIHDGNPEGNREVRIKNIVVGDGFGGFIDNLSDFNNTGLPGDWWFFRY